MRKTRPDDALLRDMLDYARRAVATASNSSIEQFYARHDAALIVERCVEIVGEAARGVSDSFKSSYPAVPWQAIIATRHTIAHEYARIESDKLYRIATVHLPEWILLLEPIVPPPPPDPEPEEL
jgi:uncharacterized protein with HEPN domain